MASVYVGIGSNLADRARFLDQAVRGIATLGTIEAGSPIYETAPLGGPEQDPYLNAVIRFDTGLGPRDLLGRLLEIERGAGRVRDEKWGPRTLDLDLLWYDGQVIDEEGLTLPHPEIRNRRFVLAPLADVSPGLRDDSGAFGEALNTVIHQPIRRVTGPYDIEGERWMIGIDEATKMERDGEVFRVQTPAEWANPNGDMFGAFLSTAALRAVGEIAPGFQPSAVTYRFVHGIPQGVPLEVEPVKIRGTDRSGDFVVSLRVDGRVLGRASVATVARSGRVIFAPDCPNVLPLSECKPIDELFAPLGRLVGASSVSWRPLERWDVPDLADGTSGKFRAWSPNLALGSDDLFLRAAAILMPIDALIWPSTMYQLGMLGTSEIVLTPTLDFSGRFPELTADPGWHLSEVTLDHMTERSVAGTIRVWADDGTYLAVGTSQNLVSKSITLTDSP